MAPVPAGRHRHIRAFSPRLVPQNADTGDEDLLPICAPNHTRNQDMHQRYTGAIYPKLWPSFRSSLRTDNTQLQGQLSDCLDDTDSADTVSLATPGLMRGCEAPTEEPDWSLALASSEVGGQPDSL